MSQKHGVKLIYGILLDDRNLIYSQIHKSYNYDRLVVGKYEKEHAFKVKKHVSKNKIGESIKHF